MATAEQLVQQIRFGLETLGERNAHHDFEALCTGLARRRITSNLLPATGPVSSGGDQGRDAESHWTNLPNEIPGTSVFVGLASTETVAVACTIQRDDVPTKIRSDLASICGTGTPVHRVVYFTVAPVPVAKRHTLQEEAQQKYSVALDIWDATGIATHLADPDLFYLAVQYLNIPSELAPPVSDSDDALPAWYLADRAKWRARTEPASTLGELIDLRSPLRHATFHAEARADIGEWLGYARGMLTAVPAIDTDTTLRVQYEIAVAALRGTNTLRPADDLVEAYFKTIVDSVTHPGLLEDAVILIQYCQGAFVRGLTGLTHEQLTTWHGQLRDKIRTLLADHPYPNAEAHLLALSARLALQTELPRDISSVSEPLTTPTEVTEYVVEALDTDQTIQLDLADVRLLDLDGGMAYLELLVERIERAPVFPVDRIADYFDFLSPLLAEHLSYPKIREGLDEATERVAGEAAKADRARNRAIRFYQADKLLDALREIHDAKINWWHGDTMHGALLAMLLAAEFYARLQLPLAAKQYALAVSLMAMNSRDPDLIHFVPRGIITAASYDYRAGSWLSATAMLEVGIQAQGRYVDGPWDFEQHSHLTDMVAYQARIFQVARDIRPQYVEFIKSTIERTGVNEVIEPIVAELPLYSEAAWAQSADQAGGGRPFNDAGPERTYVWSALGMNWRLTTKNDRVSVLAAERFVAAAQIVLAELATKDAVLLRGRVEIEVRVRSKVSRGGGRTCEMVPDNEASRWIVHLAEHVLGSIDDFHAGLTGSLAYILMTNSLLPQDQFLAVMEEAFKHGLWHKLATGRPYDEVADLLNEGTYLAMARLPSARFGANMPVTLTLAEELAPLNRPGPGYDRDESVAAARRRYENMLPMVRYTLPRLVTDLRFRTVITRLRAEGWLDWHLLQAIANLIGNRRLQWAQQPFPPRSAAEAERVDALLRRPEEPGDPQIDPVEFSESTLRFFLQTSMPSTVRGWGLEGHQPTPDFDAIAELLGARYGYWTDDAPHDNFFLWPRVGPI